MPPRRRHRTVALALSLVCAGVLGAACTAATPPSAAVTTRVQAGVAGGGAAGSATGADGTARTVLTSTTAPAGSSAGAGPTPVGLASGMTPVPGAVTCTVTRDLEADAIPVRPDRLWTSLRESSFGARETRSRHQPGCAAVLPRAPDCTVSFPFTVQDQQDVVLAFGLDRLLVGDARATPSRVASSRAPQRIVGYSAFVPAPGASAGGETALAWLRSAVERCSGGRPGRLGGVAGLVGSLASPDASPGRARTLFLVESHRAVWVVLDGGSWSEETERQAVGAAVGALLAR